MDLLKDKLLGLMGSTGYIIYYLITCILFFMPLVFLDFNFIIDIILMFIMLSVPFVGHILELILWIWSLFIVIDESFNGFILAYYIALGFYVLTTVFPFLSALFRSIFGKN